MAYISYLMMKKTRKNWDQYALGLATEAASRSEDPYRQVGACVLREDHSVAACGYNGVPAGIEIDYSDRDKRRKFMVHAETNALRYCRPDEKFSVLACNFLPCADCMKQIGAYGIKKVVFKEVFQEAHTVGEPAALEVAQAFKITLVQIS